MMLEAMNSLAKLTLSNRSAVELERKKITAGVDQEPEYYLLVDIQHCFREGGLVSDRIAVVCSSQTIRIFDSESLVRVQTISGHRVDVTGIRFSHSSPALLYTSCLDGQLRLWDMRTDLEQPVESYKVSDDRKASILCFDLTFNDRFLCAGTKCVDEEALVFFWDQRNSRSLGFYEDLHSDDVTEIEFHPSQQDLLLTGADDGLVNVLDISKATEDDALLYTFSTDCAISKLGWTDHGLDAFGITLANEHFTWDCQQGETKGKCTVASFALDQTKAGTLDYLIDSFKADDKLCTLGGSHEGILHLYDVSTSAPQYIRSLEQGHTSTVRGCAWSSERKCLYTVGEDALLCSWIASDDPFKVTSFTTSHKAKTKVRRSAQKNPYSKEKKL